MHGRDSGVNLVRSLGGSGFAVAEIFHLIRKKLRFSQRISDFQEKFPIFQAQNSNDLFSYFLRQIGYSLFRDSSTTPTTPCDSPRPPSPKSGGSRPLTPGWTPMGWERFSMSQSSM